MRVTNYFSAILLTTTLMACSANRQTSSEVAIREPGHRFLGAPKPAEREAREDLDFARLSESAYSVTPQGLVTSPTDRKVVNAGTSSATTCPDSREALIASGWMPWTGFPDAALKDQIERSHLRVEVWSRQTPPSVTVAFGGTVFKSGKDWSSNLRWFLPKHHDEYTDIVQILAPRFVEEFQKREKRAEWSYLGASELFSTGHSLGAGLAQEFAYSLPFAPDVPRVSKVFAFDSSPVTGFYSVDVTTRNRNKMGLQIDRIYERGEILAITRSFMSFIYPVSAENPTIRAVRYNLFHTVNPISGHSITELACKLDWAAHLQGR
jgi:hypothetical protein